MVPLAGGDSEGDHLFFGAGPGGVGRHRSTVKPVRGRGAAEATQRSHATRVRELQHIWVRREQMFRRIVWRDRIFLRALRLGREPGRARRGGEPGGASRERRVAPSEAAAWPAAPG